MTTYENETVGAIAAQCPTSIRVFEKAGIDYCCGGKLQLTTACEQANIPVAAFISLLQEAERGKQDSPAGDWKDAPLGELIAQIIGKHHGFVRQEIPRIEALLIKVNGRHGSNHAELREIQDTFVALAEELQAHLLKEEQVLFPYIGKLETALATSQGRPESCFGSVEFPVARMLADHEDAGELLVKIRGLANGYSTPDDACLSFKALYQGLEDFENDLHRHIHLENNILFPRAIALERKGL